MSSAGNSSTGRNGRASPCGPSSSCWAWRNNDSRAATTARFPQRDYRRPPAAVLRMVQGKGCHLRMLGENGMHRPPQLTDAFAMDDAHLQNAPFLARRQVIQHQVLNLARLEVMQIEHPVNRKLNRLVHAC